MTLEEIQSIKEFASNLGYVVKDYKNYDNYTDVLENWQFFICLPAYEDISIVDYTYCDDTMFGLMECVDVFFEEDESIKTDMSDWYSHYEEVADYPLNKLKSVLIKVMKDFKQKKIDAKKEELEKDFVN